MEQRKVVPHPLKPGYWTILIDGGIYGEYRDFSVATAWALAP